MLYKYLTKENLTRIRQTGSVRIGTLHEYRDIEKHGEEVGDSQEGIVGEYTNYDKQVIQKGGVGHDKITRSIFPLSGNGSLILHDCILSSTTSSEELYVFSMTDVFSRPSMEEFEYDSCYAIKDIMKFWQLLSNEMAAYAQPVACLKCVYGEKMVPLGTLHEAQPAILKDIRYKPQSEVRLIWRPKIKNPKPVILNIKALNNFIEVVEQEPNA